MWPIRPSSPRSRTIGEPQPYEVVGPLPASPGTNYLVNQELPVCLAWSPQGLAGGYHLQIATNADFSDPVIDVTNQTAAFYVWSNAAPATAYYYRVSTSNDGGTSDWADGAFQTVAPMIAVTVPNGGEAWQRGGKYFIQWQDNIAEDVVIDLYKGGVFLQNHSPRTPARAPIGGKWVWTSSRATIIPSRSAAPPIRPLRQQRHALQHRCP